MVSIEELLQVLVDRDGSDLHITQGSKPKIRVDGELLDTEHELLDSEATQKIVYSLLDSSQIARFEKELELDMSFGVEGLGRFRTNVFMQRGAIGAVLRIIPYEVLSVDQIGLPRAVVENLCNTPRGLILVTGATGSGKSTTLASMVDYINVNRREHIITVEDPIEFVHQNKNCLINQREIGTDSHSFPAALKHVLRQDPDVVLIGEMRDVETMEAALMISETGHLAFATLHTSDAVQTVNRIVDAFPAYQQQQVRTQLSFTLQAVFCQQLLPKTQGKGRCLAAEIMIANAAIRNLIREDKAHQMYSIIQTAQKEGMRTMNQSLLELYKSNLVSYDDVINRSSDPEELKRLTQEG